MFGAVMSVGRLMVLGVDVKGCSPCSTGKNAGASNPSIFKPVSNDITSATVLLCDTAVGSCTPMKLVQTYDHNIHKSIL